METDVKKYCMVTRNLPVILQTFEFSCKMTAFSWETFSSNLILFIPQKFCEWTQRFVVECKSIEIVFSSNFIFNSSPCPLRGSIQTYLTNTYLTFFLLHNTKDEILKNAGIQMTQRKYIFEKKDAQVWNIITVVKWWQNWNLSTNPNKDHSLSVT